MSKQKDWDSEENEVKSNWVKFNMPLEDKFVGTLIAKRKVKSMLPGKEGEMANVYDFKVDLGSFHELDDKKKLIEEPVVMRAGDFYSVGGKAMIDRQMQNAKIGQKIGMKYIEDSPSKTKGFAPAKVIKVYVLKNEDGSPQMDEAWLVEQQSTESFGNF